MGPMVRGVLLATTVLSLPAVAQTLGDAACAHGLKMVDLQAKLALSGTM